MVFCPQILTSVLMEHTSVVLMQYVWIQKEVITVLVILVMKEMDITVPVRIY